MGILKKLLVVFLGLLALLVAAAVIVPMVVDVDKYRPMIVDAANQHLNGELKLGRLSLSLWGQIHVQIDGLELQDTQHRDVMKVSDAYLHIPVLSLLSASPEIVFRLQKPAIHVTKDKAGKLNVMALVKPGPAAAPAQPTAPATSSGSVAVPGVVARARLGIEMRDADVTYHDEATGLDSQVHQLNFLAHDLSLSHPSDLELWADLNTTLGRTFYVRGPARLTAQIKPELSGGHFEHLAVTGKLLADDLELGAPGVFEKKKGMATNADLAISASDREATIQEFTVRFFNAEVKATGSITNLGAGAPAGAAPGASSDPVVNLQVASNEIPLKPWVELVPMLKEYQLEGTAKLDAEAKGPSSKLGYGAKFRVAGLTAAAPHLKQKPRIDALVSVITDQIDNLTLTMKAPANDLEIHGKLVSFTAPHADFQLTSSGMDLDQLIDFPPPAKKAAAPAEGAGAPAGTASTADYDALVAPLRESKMMQAMVANLGVSMKKLKAYGVAMSDIAARATLRDLDAEIPSFGMDLWSGTVKASAGVQLKPKTPTYHFTSQIKGLDLHQAVSTQLELIKNTVLGKADFDIAGSGASFNPDAAKKNLEAKGKLRVTDATFTTIDVSKMATEAINQAIDRVASKIPSIKGKKVGGNVERGSKYDLIASDFSISHGVFDAPNFVANSAPKQGIDLKGNTQVGIVDYKLKTDWELIDKWDVTGAKEVGADVPQVGHVDSILAEKGQPVRFPVSAACSVMAPCYSYTQVPEFLAKVAMNNLTGAATGRAKSEVQKRLQQIIPQGAPPAVQQGLQNLGNSLFGH